MKILQYSILLFFVFTVFGLNAQKKKHKEEFNVKSDVVIDINTRHSDIEIETWNRDKVVIEAYLVIEGEKFTEKEYNNFYKKWDFDVIGNSKEITVKSRANSNINIYSFDFDDINYDDFVFPLADISIGSLDVLDSVDFIMPPLPPEFPEFPEIPIPPLPVLPSEFDFEVYKKDKSYLERWKKDNEDFIGKNAKIKIVDDFIIINGDDTSISMNQWKDKKGYLKNLAEEKERYREEIKEERTKIIEEKRKHLEERRKQLKEIKKQYERERKKALLTKKKILKERAKNQKTKRIEIQKLLKERSKLKVKRIIKIKAPKNAKLNLNVKYGELSFTK